MTITKANKEDHLVLTNITKRSKAYWGYSEQLLEMWSELLTISPSYIEEKQVYKLLVDEIPVGYYAFYSLNENQAKLDNLFILPEYIGKGFGRIVMNDLLRRLKEMNIEKLIVDSDPYAEKFYEKLGFATVGKKETMVKDRFLPIMELSMH